MPGLVDLFHCLTGRRRRYRIVGRSMWPTLSPGERVWVDCGVYTCSRPQAGDIVLARHPYRTDVHIVKRVECVLSDGRCVLAGDNAVDSTDSRIFGAVPASHILGRVILPVPAMAGTAVQPAPEDGTTERL